MIKSKFFKTTMILLFASAITKLLGFIIRLYITRVIGIDGNSLLSIINPIYSLLTQIATFSFPLTISKLISEGKYRSNKVISNALILMIIINSIIIVVVGLNSHLIATYLLKNSQTNYLILALLLTLPFISLSSIVKGYFFGNERMFPYAVSNILEQCFRLLCFSLFLSRINSYNNYLSVLFIILLNIFSETFSVLIFFLFIPNKIRLSNISWHYNHSINKDIISLSSPNVLSKIIGNIIYFCEPIIIINLLLRKGISYQFITSHYALYNLYAIPLVLFPAFVISAIETSLIPDLTKKIKYHNKQGFISRIKKSLLISGLIGIIFKIIVDLFGKRILFLIYHDLSAYHYLIIINQFFFLYYLEGPINSALTALAKNKIIFKTTLIAGLAKLGLLVILIELNLSFNALLISELANILIVLLINGKALYNAIKDLFLE